MYSGTQGFSGVGAVISVNTGTTMTPVWTPVGEVQSITQSGRKMGTVSGTNLSSSAEEYITTIPNNGQFALKLNFVAADPGRLALEAAFEGKATKSYEVQLPEAPGQTTTGDLWKFNAIVSELNYTGVSVSAALGCDVTLLVTNSIVFTPGS